MSNKITANSRNVYLVGNPNSGKTSLFNAITGERHRVGNWPGVTVQKIEGITETANGRLVINDLPGTYSLTPATPEEEIVLKTLDEAATGIIINVVDIANFERNLFLTTQLVELGVNPVVSLTASTRSPAPVAASTCRSSLPFTAPPRSRLLHAEAGVSSMIEHLSRPES